MRVMHEAQMHEYNCFITLTYNDEYPVQSLRYKDFQKFARAMRKKLGKFRFYMCGEYGDKFGRPHFHACLFGMHFPDKVLFINKQGKPPLYISETLSALWTHGFSTIGELTEDSAAYVAQYVTKKITGKAVHILGKDGLKPYERNDPYTGEIIEITPEFTKMSLKKGIGQTWIEKYKDDVYNQDYVSFGGKKLHPPKYYDTYIKEQFADLHEEIEIERMMKKRSYEDETPERLKVREQIANNRQKEINQRKTL